MMFDRRKILIIAGAAVITAMSSRRIDAAAGDKRNPERKGKDMFKMVLLLTRRSGISKEAFTQAWLQARAGDTQEVGLVRRVYNVPQAGKMPIRGGTAPGMDGIEEMWFGTRRAAHASLARLDDHLRLNTAPWNLVDHAALVAMVGECHLLLEGKPREPDESVKLLLLPIRRAGMSVSAFRDHWINHHGRLVLAFPDARKHHQRIEYCPFDPVASSPLKTGSFDGIATIQFYSQADLQAGFAGEYYRTVLAPDEPRFSNAAKSFGVPVKEIVLFPVKGPAKKP